MSRKKHQHKFTFTPVPGGMKRRCRCGLVIVEYAQGYTGEPTTTGLPGTKKRKKKNDYNHNYYKKKKMEAELKTALE